ncbi:hypothetical protein [Oceanibacterium hippocampi]|uniref:Uncharacterized protein n=1 Tax=Oceanibacterium hippocampi TaxID=745714 RepID=A0A1Y5TUP7_9PROT|nr:hypothetical protein [Oceanibacterium hippocampi]SLN73478.1 hypothetical protein OCH7691_03609 [Oceanibacterium hippocampi]
MTTAPAPPGCAVVFHDLDEARTILAAGLRADRPVLLVTPKNATAMVGALPFQEIFAEASRTHPGARARLLIDCGDDAALAHALIANDATDIVFSGPDGQLRRLRNLAAARGDATSIATCRPAAWSAAAGALDEERLVRRFAATPA